MSNHNRKILCVSGGGVKAMFAAKILDLLSAHLHQPLHKVFDLMVGTSAGGVLCMYSNLYPEAKLSEVMSAKTIGKWCDKSLVDKVLGKVQFSPVYDGKGKTRSLQGLFQNTCMSQCLTNVCVPAVNLSSQTVHIFRSYEENRNINMKKVADATTAAIPYFPPVQIQDQVYIDGGFACNNPILLAYTEAKKLFPDDTINMLCVNNYDSKVPDVWQTDQVFNWGAIQWMNHGLLDFMMNMPNRFMQSQVQSLLNCNQILHLNQSFANISLDDVDQLPSLHAYANNVFRENWASMERFF